MDRRITHLTSPAFASAVSGARGIIIPLGSVEVLGPHGPLGADALVAEAAAGMLAARAGCLAAPVIPYGDTLELAGWPGTVHVPGAVLEGLYYAVARSFLDGGARAAIFLAAHSLNAKAADAACRRLTAEGHKALLLDWWRACALSGGGIIDDPGGFGHGGEMITSVVMAVAPEAVRLEHAVHEQPRPGLARASKYQLWRDACQAYGTFREYCGHGAWGDVTRASAEKGRAVMEAAAARLAEAIGEALEGNA